MYIIVGLDPGTSVGIGIINLNGEVVNLFSGRDMGINEIVAYIRQFGTPVLIASDVDHIPYTLYKVATALNAKIFVPEHPISVSEKIFLTRNIKYHDAHQRDSLSAALYAYKKHKNLFEKIKNMGYGDDVKALVLKGKSLAEAIAETSEKLSEMDKIALPSDIPDQSEVSIEKFNEIKEHLRILEKANKILKAQIKTKDAEIENLKNNIRMLEREMKFKTERAITKEEKFEKIVMEASIKNLIEQIRNAKEVIEKLENLYERIGREEIYLVGVYPEIFNGLTYIDKYSVFKKSDTDKIEIAFTDKKIPNIKIAPPQKLKKISNIYYIERKDLDEIKAINDIESIIEEYRRMRKSAH